VRVVGMPSTLARMTMREAGGAPLPVPGRSVVMTRYGMVATSQPLAAMAGVEVLRAGGHAADAAIAASAAMALMEPTGTGLGGDLFALVHDATAGSLHGLDAAGWAPSDHTAARLRARGLNAIPLTGVDSVTVPGVVAGWAALADRFGRLPFPDLLAPAIRYADEGFPVGPVTARLWRESTSFLASDPDAAATFLVDGDAPAAGGLFRNPGLARTLGRVAAEGASGFYEGAVAEAIIAACRGRGGTMTRADLGDYRAEWVEPVATAYRGWTVHEIPPPGQGVAALMMLQLMEPFPLGEWGFHAPDTVHALIEAKKLAYADMVAHVGDPRHTDIPVARLLDRARAAERGALIDMARAAERVEPDRLPGVTDRPGSDTIYLAAADRAGNMVSLIQSNYAGFGSGLVPEGAGFMLQNRGALFSLDAGHPNVLAPRKRPLHTIIPGFMEKGEAKIAFGIMGGWNQAQAHAQFVSNIVDHGMDVQQALEAGRITKLTFDGLDVAMEATVPAATRAELEARGHRIEVHGPRTPTFGYGHAIRSATGVRHGAADPRHDGAAIPEQPF
jgi:gamma-glutamyltranspeptidase / glutathione hydrolase